MAELLDRGGAELRCGGARRGCALVFVVAAEEGRRVQGVAGRLKKGCRRSRRAGQEGKAAGIMARDLSQFLLRGCEGCGEEGGVVERSALGERGGRLAGGSSGAAE